MSTCNAPGVEETRVSETDFRSCQSRGCYILRDKAVTGDPRKDLARHGGLDVIGRLSGECCLSL